MFQASQRPHYLAASVFVYLCTLLPAMAHGSLASCQQAKKKSVEACNKAMTDAVAKSQADAAMVSAACNEKDANGNSKRGIANCANDMKNSGGLSNSFLDKALKSCDEQQSSCNQACN